jgi:hypothetical protein
MRARSLIVVTLIAVFGSIAGAAPRVDSFLGISSDESWPGTIYRASAKDAPTTAPAGTSAIGPLKVRLDRLIAESERVAPVGRWPDLPEEKERRAAFESARRQKMGEIVESIATVTGRISFRVVDVRVRPQPRRPAALFRPPPEAEALRRERLAAFERDQASIERQPLVAIGSVKLAAPPAAEKARQTLLAATYDFDRRTKEARKQIASAKSDFWKTNAQRGLERVEAERKQLIPRLRKAYDDASQPDDYVYLFGTPDDFRLWQPGQTRSVVASIERVRVELRPDNDGKVRAMFDAVLTPC